MGRGSRAAALAVAFDGEVDDGLNEEKAAKELALVQSKKKEEAAAREAEQRRIRAGQLGSITQSGGWLEDALNRSTAERRRGGSQPGSRSRSRERDDFGFPSTRPSVELGMLGFGSAAHIKRRAASDKNPAHEGLDGIKAELLRERGLVKEKVVSKEKSRGASKEKSRGDRSRSRDRKRNGRN